MLSIETMPRLLSEADYPVSHYIEIGYAAYVVRRILGRGQLDRIEDQVLSRLYAHDLYDLIDTIFIDPEQAAPPLNRGFYEEVVAYVLGHLTPEGFLDYETSAGIPRRTDHPRSVACLLSSQNPFVTESHVRRAHAVLIERGSREARFYRRRRKDVA